MIDAEDRPIRRSCSAESVERLGRLQIPAERFLDDDAGRPCGPGLAELFDDELEKHRRNGEIVGRMLGGAEFLAQGRERGRIL